MWTWTTSKRPSHQKDIGFANLSCILDKLVDNFSVSKDLLLRCSLWIIVNSIGRVFNSKDIYLHIESDSIKHRVTSAQILPITVEENDQLIGSITLTGHEKTWYVVNYFIRDPHILCLAFDKLYRAVSLKSITARWPILPSILLSEKVTVILLVNAFVLFNIWLCFRALV